MIELRDLKRSFGQGATAVHAVRGLSLRVEPGEVYGLMGPNGAGKTTALRMVLGLLRPTSGDAVIDGVSVTDDPDGVKRRIGLVSASAGLYPWLTPRETLRFFADLYGVPSQEAAQRAAHLAERFGLTEFLDRRCAGLSTGQTQRVNLARAVMHQPPAMLLDEPTRGLDVVGSQRVFEFVRDLREQQRAVILCTHRLAEAERFCDRFGLLHHGTLRHEGTLDELQAATGRETLTEMFVDLLSEEEGLAEAPTATRLQAIP
ncbi:ABC transporter ATP-binding protein [Alienimonas chondri]|uniref:ABC transporter ATP-binding protein NatA n=1 Tax=Alienimonas chondri TaxID=2681879 RepID=A0ABX1VCN1_9PLAN|nr:ABC transporter ATP-binding protein [Alienimonas chondri]NNJ25855.1 ABC transporter ATP-binding protein NatA [Alienimonas chondri]